MVSHIGGTSDIGLSLSTERKVMRSNGESEPLALLKASGLSCLRSGRGHYDDEWPMVQFRRGTATARELVSAVPPRAFTHHKRSRQPHMPRLWLLRLNHAG